MGLVTAHLEGLLILFAATGTKKFWQTAIKMETQNNKWFETKDLGG